jgi:hypothetical protein
MGVLELTAQNVQKNIAEIKNKKKSQAQNAPPPVSGFLL